MVQIIVTEVNRPIRVVEVKASMVKGMIASLTARGMHVTIAGIAE